MALLKLNPEGGAISLACTLSLRAAVCGASACPLCLPPPPTTSVVGRGWCSLVLRSSVVEGFS